ncbi:MAG: YkgJ family cysteine cluster protein [bacterium]
MSEFRCRLCGKCCKNIRVVLMPEDVFKLSDELDIDVSDFLKNYTEFFLMEYEKENSLVYISAPVLNVRENGECVFLRENRCSFYNARPEQCKRLPFVSHPVIFSDNIRDISSQCPAACHMEPENLLFMRKRENDLFVQCVEKLRSFLRRKSYNLDKVFSVDMPAPQTVSFNKKSGKKGKTNCNF